MWFYKHYLCINPAKIPLSMERAELLLLKMLEQLRRNASASQLLENLRLLEAEILRLAPVETSPLQEIVAEHMPPPAEQEKEYAVLQIDEAEVERELEELKAAAERIEEMSLRVRPAIQWEEETDTEQAKPLTAPSIHPSHRTLTPPPVDSLLNPAFRETEEQSKPAARVIRKEQPLKTDPAKEVNDAISHDRPELAQRFMDSPIRDLKKAIGINDRYRFIQELFAGDEMQFEQAIKTINSFSIYPEAEFWIRKELKAKLGWKASDPVALQFDQLIKRRFS
jgi:hypothetical protein